MHSPARAMPLPPPSDHFVAWTDKEWLSPSAGDAIYCNRSLNMQYIKACGFDMDWTLAQYLPESFEQLAYDYGLKKLVDKYDFPKEILQFQFDPGYMVRGLTVDKANGNIIKMDRHKYVKLAYHGFRELTADERMRLYEPNMSTGFKAISYEEPLYTMVDTLFSLGSTYMFAQLVEHMDAQPQLYANKKGYKQVFNEIIEAIDWCHRDGSLKRAVAENPEKFIFRDASLVPMFDLLRSSGKRVFLVTNSLWDYTNVVMNFLCEGRVGADRNLDWLRHFDLVVVGAQKPSFFTGGANILKVNPHTGALYNTDNGQPLLAVDMIAAESSTQGVGAADHPGRSGWLPSAGDEDTPVFQGGSSRHLHAMLGVTSGSQVLYVGDHIYGDILRSKKQIGWRTMLIIPELAVELEVRKTLAHKTKEFAEMRQRRAVLEDEIQRIEWALAHGMPRRLSLEVMPAGSNGAAAAAAAAAALVAGRATSTNGLAQRTDSISSPTDTGAVAVAAAAAAVASAPDVLSRLETLRKERDEIRTKHREGLRAYHERFHPVWGQLMKTGHQNSRFSHLVERFACLYTSHVGNLLAYSPLKSYRSKEDTMPHESGW